MLEHATFRAGTALLCCVILFYGAFHDMLARTIPDWVAIVVLLLGLLVALRFHTLPLSLPIALGIFGVGLLAYRQGILGGGDVKLLAASSLLVRPAEVPMQFEIIAVSGGVLAIFYLSARRFVAVPAQHRPTGTLRRALRVEQWRIRRRGPLPYGVAIAFGTCSLLARH